MKPAAAALILCVLLLVVVQLQLGSGQDGDELDIDEVYIVYFGQHSGEKTHYEIEDTHHSYLFSVKDSEEQARASLLYSYKHTINGFAALLTPNQASTLSELEEVVSVFRSYPRKHTMHTTRSWEFVGLDIEELDHDHLMNKPNATSDNHDLLMRARYGNGAIVGLLDNGVWPESKSFSDQQMGPIPNSWKGICQTGQDFESSHCNKKLIGARYYLKGYEQRYGPLNTTIDYRSPRDKDGHGTHTASTVGGQRVAEASALGGFALGTASGGAPLVHLAIYKVCWAIPHQGKEEGNTCFEEDMLAAIDDAIADGVNVLSISIGTSKPTSYEHDGIAIGALHAIKNDIVVACSAGNEGPTSGTSSNNAPWIITVGASSVDRAFTAPLTLGNGITLEGQTVTPYKMEKKMYPLVYAAQVSSNTVPKNATTDGQCLPGSLEPEKVKGKIVMCMRGQGTRVGKGYEVKRAGGVGFILGNSLANGAELTVDAHVLPATALDSESAIQILKYIYATENPTAYIAPAKTILNHKPAPFMAAFSSRGPNPITPDILKPDITAPGLNILAAWSEVSSPTKLEDDARRVKYNILSGTSMSCPHVAAAAALLKVIHPTWSSASIRSALITSAGLTNNKGMFLTDASGHKPADPFQFGSGHFRPTKAADPGLVYDASYTDYLLFLCSNGLTNIDPSFKCPELSPSSNNLNYPSIAISKISNNETVIINRTVTNMGDGKSVYLAKVRSPAGFSVNVSPSTLFFEGIGEKKTFTVTVRPRQGGRKVDYNTQYSFGWLTWSDGVHIVRSPIAVSSSSSA
ncbi:subtilisin-like protease SBT5.6 [Impatiens glandulifera]|uniref:subtilisin-like protease SBT5.6 n=1 Tax=Impatiens glandulifera TaxID=253017 RepID=UPI001FB196FA|nr:subtilisin-like protease SBT5.6 [Impatiens glandulifera]